MGGDIEHRLITTFGRLVETYSALERRLGADLERACGIPHTWFEVLLRTARTPGGITMTALADQIALTSGGLTRLVDRMIASGLVERVACPTDRRISFAVLTATGRRKLEQAAEIHARNLERAFAEYTDADLPRWRACSAGWCWTARPDRAAVGCAA